MIRFLLMLYPRAWRERYGREILDLVAAEGMRPSDALDIARAAIQARLRASTGAFRRGGPMTAGPIHRHPTAWAIAGAVLLLPTTAFVAGSLAAYQFGLVAIQGPMDRVAAAIDSFRVLDLLLVAAPLVALLLAALPLVRLDPGADAGEVVAVIRVRLRRANVAVIGVALVVGAALAWYFAGEVTFGGTARI
jgi:hypothetical protein